MHFFWSISANFIVIFETVPQVIFYYRRPVRNGSSRTYLEKWKTLENSCLRKFTSKTSSQDELFSQTKKGRVVCIGQIFPQLLNPCLSFISSSFKILILLSVYCSFLLRSLFESYRWTHIASPQPTELNVMFSALSCSYNKPDILWGHWRSSWSSVYW